MQVKIVSDYGENVFQIEDDKVTDLITYAAGLSKTENTQKGYKGFMLIKCAGCGDIRGFCTKRPITENRCDICGTTTQINDVTPVYLRCECGADFKYLTNIKDDEFDYKCMKCGRKINLHKSRKGNAYVTSKGGEEAEEEAEEEPEETAESAPEDLISNWYDSIVKALHI